MIYRYDGYFCDELKPTLLSIGPDPHIQYVEKDYTNVKLIKFDQSHPLLQDKSFVDKFYIEIIDNNKQDILLIKDHYLISKKEIEINQNISHEIKDIPELHLFGGGPHIFIYENNIYGWHYDMGSSDPFGLMLLNYRSKIRLEKINSLLKF